MSRKLKSTYNIYSRWESGTNEPSWVDFTEICDVAQKDLKKFIKRDLYFSGDPRRFDLLVTHLIGTASIKEIGEMIGASRFKMSRWVGGKSSPSLCEMIRLIDACSTGLLSLLDSLIGASKLPSIATEIRRAKEREKITEGEFHLLSILLATKLKSYRDLARHKHGFIARQVGLSLAQETAGLRKLEALGLIEKIGDKYRPQVLTIDDTPNRAALREHLAYWLDRSANAIKIKRGAFPSSLFGIRLFDVSDESFVKIKEAYIKFYSTCQAILAADKRVPTKVCILGIQLLSLDEDPAGPLFPPETE